MSRVSRKSELSPSITRGSGGIDLGKNSGVDMGRKSEPSFTSGGVGLTQEVTNVGGMSVSGGIEVDLTPVDFGVNYDTSENTVSISTGAEVPGGLLGVSGGIEIDLNTGEVIGGSIGGEVGGVGINLSNSKKGGLGIEFTVQIPGTPIELSLGFGFPPKKPKPGAPPSSSDIETDPENKGFSPNSQNWPIFDPACYYTMVVILLSSEEIHENCTGYSSHDGAFGYAFEGREKTGSYSNCITGITFNSYYNVYEPVVKSKQILGSVFSRQVGWMYIVSGNLLAPSKSFNGGSGVAKGESIIRTGNYAAARIVGMGGSDWGKKFQQLLDFYNNGRDDYTSYAFVPMEFCPKKGGGTNPIFNNSNNPPSSPSSPGPFPNPPPRRQKKMDSCCRENLAFLRLIYTKLGLAKFPGQLPNTIIQEVAEPGEAPAEPPQVPIPDLVSLLTWTFERDDERWGQWVVQIDVKDSDITTEGDQGKPVKFPNLAESIAEIEGQILSLTANVEGLLALSVKNLAESGLGRQEAIKSYLAAKAIIKYMAFETTETDIEIPACFTPGAETIHELVNESTIHLKGIDYTGKETLRDIYLDLLQAAAIIRAIHWQRIDTKRDTKTQLLDVLKSTVGLANSIKNPTRPDGTAQPKSKQDFEDFIDTVEDGFRNITGVTDSENPYGKTPDRRPRIRQLGENISQAGGKS